jgi:hypothetical protein
MVAQRNLGRCGALTNLMNTKDENQIAATHYQGGGAAPAVQCLRARIIDDLIDGTYELFRHFHGLRRFTSGEDRPVGAVVGVLNGTSQMLEDGATHVGVATDHVIESFRTQLWPDHQTGEGSSARCAPSSIHSPSCCGLRGARARGSQACRELQEQRHARTGGEYLAHMVAMEEISRASASVACPTARTPTSASTRSTATATPTRRNATCRSW